MGERSRVLAIQVPLCHKANCVLKKVGEIEAVAVDSVKWLCMSKAVRSYLAGLVAHNGKSVAVAATHEQVSI